MSTDYHPMWKDLGLDLEAHDALLGVLGPLYEQTLTKQPNRPAGMKYFDFVMSEVHDPRIKELMALGCMLHGAEEAEAPSSRKEIL